MKWVALFLITPEEDEIVTHWGLWSQAPFLQGSALYGGQSNVPQRCPHPDPQNLWICDVTRQGGTKVADGTKVVISWFWNGAIILVYLRGPNIITKTHVSERVWCESQCKRDSVWAWLSWPLLVLRGQEGATSWGMREAPRKWTREWNWFTPGASRRNNPIDTIIFQWDLFRTFDLQNYKVINLHSYKPQFVVICFSSHWKQLHFPLFGQWETNWPLFLEWVPLTMGKMTDHRT